MSFDWNNPMQKVNQLLGAPLKSLNSIKAIATFFVLGGFLYRKAIQIHKKIRHIQDTPKSKIATAAQGFVGLQGFAWPSAGSVKTINDQDVIYYDFRLERLEGKGKGKKWVQVFQKEFKPAIYLVDPTGLAFIDPQYAEFEMLEKKIKNWNFLNKKAQEFVLNKLIRGQVTGFPPSSFWGGFLSTQYRIKEFYIRHGSPLYATGVFQTVSQEPTSIKLKGLTRFGQMVFDYENRTERKNLNTILDTNKDGKVTYHESIDGFTLAASLAMKRSRLDSLNENEFSVFGHLSNSDQHKLFLAPSKEKHLLENLKLKPLLFLAGGAALITVALFLFFGSEIERLANMTTMASTEALPNLDIETLHNNCVKGTSSDCVFILENQKQFQFEKIHLDYYTSKACSLGVQKYCR